MYQQTYDPLGNTFLSTLVAAIPILTLLYFIALHRHRDAQGNVHLGISAPYAAFFGVIAAFVVSCLVFRMPVVSAVSAFALGSLSGFLGIIWIVLAAMFLYTMSVVTGKFEIVKESVVHISFDRRLQCVLIAFSFGAIIEGTSGFGTPVAIAGAVMVGLGFKPFQSAVLNLLANTAPVAWGAIGTPIVTLAAVSGLDQVTLSSMAGHQLPFVSVLVPFWLVATFVKMEGGSWKEVFEVWPATLCAGGSFALMQFFASGTSELHLMTDVVSGVFSVICTALFLRFVWHPKTRFLLQSERQALAQAGKNTATATTDSTEWKYKYSATETAYAWMPWVILIACCALWGVPEFKMFLNNLFSGITFTTTLLGSKFSGSLSLPVFVFLTGSDTASNALFGSLQRITAQQLNLNPILIVATNSTGGVMGKMIDAQSIMVACAACYDDPKERSFALGPIFRTVFFHSIAGAAVIGVIALLQAYVFPGMIPIPPVGK
jgi:lactate permease